jgi:CelD/BcsL family acetyltransferase involved in cellulose biosynthesis
LDFEDLGELEAADDVRAQRRPWRLEIEIGPAPSPSALEPEWRALLARSNASFFLSWPWIATWLERHAPTVRLARIAHEGRTVALALLGERKRGLGPLAIRSSYLHATGDRDADRIAVEYNDVLAARGYEAAARITLLDRLLSGRGRSRAAILPMVGGEMEAAAAAAGFRCRRRSESRCAIVDLEALRRWGRGYLHQLSSSTRAQIRRAARLYEARGPLRIEAAQDAAEAVAWLEPLAALHEARFRAKGIRGAFGVPGFVEFHSTLVARAWGEGSVELLRVRAGEEPIGYLYNFLWRDWVGYYTSGFVYTDDNRLKPGLVAHWLAIERHLAGAARVYDFMAGESRYKVSLAEPGPVLFDLVVEPDDRLARWAELARRVRDRLRRVLRRSAAGGTARVARLVGGRVSCYLPDRAGRARFDPFGRPEGDLLS